MGGDTSVAKPVPNEADILREAQAIIQSTPSLTQPKAYANPRTGTTTFTPKCLGDSFSMATATWSRIQSSTILTNPSRQPSFKSGCLSTSKLSTLQFFQNLVKNKSPAYEKSVEYSPVKCLPILERKGSIFKDQKAREEIELMGEELLRDRKVAVIMFVECSGSKFNDKFEKEFYKEEAGQECLFEILMGRLRVIGEKFNFPPTYIFYSSRNYTKIADYLSTFAFKEQVSTFLQSTQPIINLFGQLCLKDANFPDVIQLPNGAGDFYQANVRGVSFIEKLRKDGIEYVQCLDCENILEKVVDPYMLGLLSRNFSQVDLIYKCTYSENEKELQSKRIILENLEPKVDYMKNFVNSLKKMAKNKGSSKDVLNSSPVWMNSVAFHVDNFLTGLENFRHTEDFHKMFTARMKHSSYWSPTDKTMHLDEPCYVFERDLSDLLINRFFKSQAIMVEREEEYLPVLTSHGEANWKDAYKGHLIKQNLKFQQKHLSNTVMNSFNADIQSFAPQS